MIAGIAVALLGLVAGWLSLDLGIGTLTDPGPGLWPLIVSVLLSVLGVLIAIQREGTEPFTRQALFVGLGLISLAAYAAVIEHVGFEIPTIVLLAVWLRFLGNESWRTTAVVSVLATAGAYGLFITALGVPVPHLIGV